MLRWLGGGGGSGGGGGAASAPNSPGLSPRPASLTGPPTETPVPLSAQQQEKCAEFSRLLTRRRFPSLVPRLCLSMIRRVKKGSTAHAKTLGIALFVWLGFPALRRDARRADDAVEVTLCILMEVLEAICDREYERSVPRLSRVTSAGSSRDLAEATVSGGSQRTQPFRANNPETLCLLSFLRASMQVSGQLPSWLEETTEAVRAKLCEEEDAERARMDKRREEEEAAAAAEAQRQRKDRNPQLAHHKRKKKNKKSKPPREATGSESHNSSSVSVQSVDSEGNTLRHDSDSSYWDQGEDEDEEEEEEEEEEAEEGEKQQGKQDVPADGDTSNAGVADRRDGQNGAADTTEPDSGDKTPACGADMASSAPATTSNGTHAPAEENVATPEESAFNVVYTVTDAAQNPADLPRPLRAVVASLRNAARYVFDTEFGTLNSGDEKETDRARSRIQQRAKDLHSILGGVTCCSPDDLAIPSDATEEVRGAIGLLLFLRLICAALIMPTDYGVAGAEPPLPIHSLDLLVWPNAGGAEGAAGFRADGRAADNAEAADDEVRVRFVSTDTVSSACPVVEVSQRHLHQQSAASPARHRRGRSHSGIGPAGVATEYATPRQLHAWREVMAVNVEPLFLVVEQPGPLNTEGLFPPMRHDLHHPRTSTACAALAFIAHLILMDQELLPLCVEEFCIADDEMEDLTALAHDVTQSVSKEHAESILASVLPAVRVPDAHAPSPGVVAFLRQVSKQLNMASNSAAAHNLAEPISQAMAQLIDMWQIL